MAKEAAILRSELFPVAEQAIGLGLESRNLSIGMRQSVIEFSE